MTRPYGVKDRKRKKKEKDDAEEDEAEQMEVKRAMTENSNSFEEEKPAEEAQDADAADELEGIPVVPSDRNTDKSKVIFVLERASLEVAKVGKVFIRSPACGLHFFSFDFCIIATILHLNCLWALLLLSTSHTLQTEHSITLLESILYSSIPLTGFISAELPDFEFGRPCQFLA